MRGGCCGQSASDLDISAWFQSGDPASGVEPTCGMLKGLFKEQSCCAERIELQRVWCDATNCTYFGSPTHQRRTCTDTMTVHHYLSVAEQQDQPDGFPYHLVAAPVWEATIQLPQSTSDVLLTLLWVKSDDCNQTYSVARSYSDYPWEGIMPGPVFPDCDDSTGNCVLDLRSLSLPSQISNTSGAFLIQMRQRLGKSVTEAEEVARLMIQGTFGVTKTEINTVLDNFGPCASNGHDISNDADTAVAAGWFAAEVQKPPTYLRQRYRRNCNPRMYPGGDYSSGEAYGRCEVGSRWHRYAFNYWDKGRLIDMKASPAGVFQLFIDGVLRTELASFLIYTWAADHPDVQFYICGVTETSDPASDRALFTYPTAIEGATCNVYNFFRKVEWLGSDCSLLHCFQLCCSDTTHAAF